MITKLLLTTLLFFAFTVNLLAQAEPYKISLEEGIKLSQQSNKPLLFMSYNFKSPFYGRILRIALADKQVGDFLNNNTIFVAYSIGDYSTNQRAKELSLTNSVDFIVFHNGEEINRFDAKFANAHDFLTVVKWAINPLNSKKNIAEQYKKEPKYGIYYGAALMKDGMTESAMRIAFQGFKAAPIEERYSNLNLYFYNKVIKNIDSDIFRYMLSDEGKAEMLSVMPLSDYCRIIQNYATLSLSNATSVRHGETTSIRQFIRVISRYTDAHSSRIKFVIDNRAFFNQTSVGKGVDILNELSTKAHNNDLYFNTMLVLKYISPRGLDRNSVSKITESLIVIHNKSSNPAHKIEIKKQITELNLRFFGKEHTEELLLRVK